MSDAFTRIGSPAAVPASASGSPQATGGPNAGAGATANGPPYPSTVAPVGGVPTVGVDDPISAVLIVLFLVLAALHMKTFQANLRRGHKFLFSAMMFAFCVIRALALILRIVWASSPRNVRVAIAANILTQAGTVIVFIVNLFLCQRLVRSYHGGFGWSTPARIIFRALLACVVLCLIMVIVATVQSFFTLDRATRAADHTVQLVAGTYLAVLAFLPIPIVTISALLPRRYRVEPFGEGSCGAKLLILLPAAALMTLGAAYRVGANWNPLPLTDPTPAWYNTRAPYYVFNFGLDLLVSILYLGAQFDRRFYVPNGAKGPGSYQEEMGNCANSTVVQVSRKPRSQKGAGDTNVEKAVAGDDITETKKSHRRSESTKYDTISQSPRSNKRSPTSGSINIFGQNLPNDSQGTLYGPGSSSSPTIMGAQSPTSPLSAAFPPSLQNHAAIAAAALRRGSHGPQSSGRTEAGNSETLVGTSAQGESHGGNDNENNNNNKNNHNHNGGGSPRRSTSRGGSRMWGSEGLRLASPRAQQHQQRRDDHRADARRRLADAAAGALAWEALQDAQLGPAGAGGRPAPDGGLSTTTSDDDSGDWRTARMGYSSASPDNSVRPSAEQGRRSGSSDRWSTVAGVSRRDENSTNNNINTNNNNNSDGRKSVDSLRRSSKQVRRFSLVNQPATVTTAVAVRVARAAQSPVSSSPSPPPTAPPTTRRSRRPQSWQQQQQQQQPPLPQYSNAASSGGSSSSSGGRGSSDSSSGSSPDLFMSGAGGQLRLAPPVGGSSSRSTTALPNSGSTSPGSGGGGVGVVVGGSGGSSPSKLNARGTSDRRRVRSSRQSQQMRRASLTAVKADK